MEFKEINEALHNKLKKNFYNTPLINMFKLTPLPPVLFCAESYESVASDLTLILKAQSIILSYLMTLMSQDEILEYFNVPVQIRDLVDWSLLKNGGRLIGRADVLLDKNGKCWLCELNVGPAIEGPLMHEVSCKYLKEIGFDTNGLKHGVSPYSDLARLIKNLCDENQKTRVILLDLEAYEHWAGSIAYHPLLNYVRLECPGIEVLLVNENSYLEEWFTYEEGSKNLVYRLFLEEEIVDGGELVRRICNSGALLLNTFENYVTGCKSWFSLFHDPILRSNLEQKYLSAIDRRIPKTIRVSKENLSALLKKKEEYVFKKCNSTGGKGVILGEESTSENIILSIQNNHSQWIAQEVIHQCSYKLPDINFNVFDEQFVVFGLYYINNNTSGLSVRSNKRSKAVNVSSGGMPGWALPITSDENKILLTCLDVLFKDSKI
ncbi:hypothetical protein [Pantoea ananatis]|uniref:hypothetical protein n=1 Tax=Pantoea ananas TaxID=553 RepID=UPI0019061CA4|nr:hypothetical protein [Pantoea ananatis]